MSGSFAITPSVQSPRAYDLKNLTGLQLGARFAAASSAAMRGYLATALQDSGYRYNIAPWETAAGLTAASLTFGYDPGNVLRYGIDSTGVVDCSAALTSLLVMCATAQVPCYAPAGTYKAQNVPIPNFLVLRGDGWRNTIFKAPGANPVFINVDQLDCKQVTLSGFKLNFGTHGIKFSTTGSAGVVSLWDITDVRFEDNSVCGILCDGFYIANNHTRSIFDSTLHGIRVTSNTANLNTFLQCRWEEMDDNSIAFTAGGEGNTIIGGRFEARNTVGATGGVVILLTNCKATKFQGCYFENCFAQILSETGSTDTTVFDTCKFTGQENEVAPAGWKREIFSSDGVVIFAWNYFGTGSSGSQQMSLIGTNYGLLTTVATGVADTGKNVYRAKSVRDLKFATKTKSLVLANSGVAFDLMSFARAAAASSRQEREMFTADMRVSCMGEESVSGNAFVFSRTYLLTVSGYATGVIAIGVVADANGDSLGATGATLTFATKAGATNLAAVLQATLTCANLEAADFMVSIDGHLLCEPTKVPMTVGISL